MVIFLLWILLSVGVGMLGSGRKIGFGGAFFLSLILSPLIGGIITLASDTKIQAEMLKEMQRQKATPATTPPDQKSVADELQKLKALLDEGYITQEDFEAAKKKLLS